MNPENTLENAGNETSETLFSNQPVFWQLLILLLILIAIFSSAIFGEIRHIATERAREAMGNGQHFGAAAITAQNKPVQISNVSVEAATAFVYDVSTGATLYKKDSETVYPLASITKLMTALLAHEILSESAGVTINPSATKQEGNSGIDDGETFYRGDLSELVLLTSSNDGAYALAERAGRELDEENPVAAFVAAMNIRAKDLGFNSLRFSNPTGLDVSPYEAGAYGTAEDVARLMSYLIITYPEIVTPTAETNLPVYNLAGDIHEAENTNSMVANVDGLLASKTGFTDLAGGNLVIAYDAGLNRPIVISVLGSSRTGRFSDVMTLVKAVNKTLTPSQN